MHKSEVIEYFGTQKKVADAISISQAAVSKWPEIVPELQAMKLERVTKGGLKYDASLYQKDHAA